MKIWNCEWSWKTNENYAFENDAEYVIYQALCTGSESKQLASAQELLAKITDTLLDKELLKVEDIKSLLDESYGGPYFATKEEVNLDD